MEKVNFNKMEIDRFGLKSGISCAADSTVGGNCYDGGEDGCDNTCDNDSGCDVY